MTATNEVAPALSNIEGIDSYLQQYGKSLAAAITSKSKPLYEPGKEKWHERMDSLLRVPFQAQGDVIMGLTRCLEKHKGVFVVGECGVGKTLIGIATPYILNKKPYRVIVMCPGHLVRKWAREVRQTVPKAKAYAIQSFADLIPLRVLKGKKPVVPEYYIISRDRAKLGFFWRPACVMKQGLYCCPHCFTKLMCKDDVPVTREWFSRRQYCPECDAALWQADNSRCRRYAPAEFIKKYLSGFWDMAVFDEMHELKSGASAQGNAFGIIASACTKVMAMTGTLCSGYADDMHYLLYRLCPDALKREDIGWSQSQKFLSRYGVLEYITKVKAEDPDNYCSRGKRESKYVKRKPGVSPLVFSRHLMGQSAFLQLEDISDALPEFDEEVIQVPLRDVLGNAYKRLESQLVAAVRKELALGSKKLLGMYLNALLAYPDRPFAWEELRRPGTRELVARPLNLPQAKPYPKEEELLRIVKEELKQRRRVYVYCTYTNKRDVSERLQRILKRDGIRTEVLRSKVKPEAREVWIEDKVKKGIQVIISNSRLVQTGLDLLDFPTLIFYQTGFSVFTLRQASRRSWRIGQEQPVKVIYLSYENTMQERAMQLMGQKLSASLALEGKFSEEGLMSLTQGDDLTTALAKALVEKAEMESVEQIWKGLRPAKTSQTPTATTRRFSREGIEQADRFRDSVLLNDVLGKSKQGEQQVYPASSGMGLLSDCFGSEVTNIGSNSEVHSESLLI